MNTLIIGCGVIGTIYGQALSEAGVSITHYVRENKIKKYQDGITLNILDGRKSKQGIERSERYYPKLIDTLDQTDDYDLVIISVNFYQLEDVLKNVTTKFENANFLIFNNMWSDTKLIEKYIPANKYLLGFPNAGGGYQKNKELVLNGALLKDIHIGTSDGRFNQSINSVSSLFEQASIEVKIEENMLHWLWIHFATNAGLNSAMIKAHGAKNFLTSTKNIKQGIINVKEALNVCRARNVKLKNFSDAKMFSMPTTILAIILKNAMKSDSLSTRVMLEYKGAEELKRIYENLVETAHQLNVSIPNLEMMEDEITNAENYLV